MRIYISGKITGLDPKIAKANFDAIEWALRHYGHDVFNPLQKNPEGLTWEQYMVRDIKILLSCDAIYMMNNWQDSKGAVIEHSVAQRAGLKIYYQNI